jgi:hypothetical protein
MADDILLELLDFLDVFRNFGSKGFFQALRNAG